MKEILRENKEAVRDAGLALIDIGSQLAAALPSVAKDEGKRMKDEIHGIFPSAFVLLTSPKARARLTAQERRIVETLRSPMLWGQAFRLRISD